MTDIPVLDCNCDCGSFLLGAPRGSTSPHIEGDARRGECHPLVFAYVQGLSDDGVRWVQGTVIGDQNARIEHSWVVEANGWVWDPTSDLWFHDEEAFKASGIDPEPVYEFTPSEALAGRALGQVGYWHPPVA